MISIYSLRVIIVLCLLCLLGATAIAAPIGLDNLTPGMTVHGFRATARFLNDENKPMGGRFVHEKTGFIFDLLQIPSVPQGFIWVRSFPTSDKGEPHTQEHLLLGKGNKGKWMANLEGMSLVQSSAYTEQWHTCYHFYTVAGTDVFFNVMQQQLDALLHPDYTDEEIRREVCNYGVTDDPATHVARLEEKGTVYNEMVSAYERPWSHIERTLAQLIYGEHHPMAYESGGLPSAIRTMTPQDIRTFHANAYHLANMGMQGSFGPEESVDSVLMRMDGALMSLTDARPAHFMTEADLPAPHAASAGTITIASYPDRSESRPSPLIFAWPATRTLDTRERMLADLFIASLAGDATTSLYNMFIDTRNRKMDIGARDVFGWVGDDQGHPVYIGFSTIAPSAAVPSTIAAIRATIVDEIVRIAAMPEGSPELRQFNERVQNRVVEMRRAQSKFVNSPPGFGFRNGGTGSDWMNRLNALTATGRFDLSVTMGAELAFVDSLLSSNSNFWADYIIKWKLMELPYAVAGKPSPETLQREESDRAARSAAEVARLKTLYNTPDDAQAIARYSSEYDHITAALDSTDRLVPSPKFIAHPPLTADDHLAWASQFIPPLTHADSIGAHPASSAAMHQHHVEAIVSTFENMTSATVGLSLLVRTLAPDQYLYLSLLPELLTRVGVIEHGAPVRYDEMQERLRKEILGLSADFNNTSSNDHGTTLVVRASGNTTEESQKAAAWIGNVLYHPDWRPENLPRIRDVVEQSLSALRNTMQQSEESWVQDPADAFRRQTNPEYLATGSFLTRMYNAMRLRWRLMDATQDPQVAQLFAASLKELKNAARMSDRHGLGPFLRVLQGDSLLRTQVPHVLVGQVDDFAKLSRPVRMLIADAAKDLEQLIGGIPDASLASDWEGVCAQIVNDFSVQPKQALADLDAVRATLLHRETASMFVVGSHENCQALETRMEELVGGLDTAEVDPMQFSRDEAPDAKHNTGLITQRLHARTTIMNAPMFVGLVNPNTQSGVFLNSSECDGYPRGWDAVNVPPSSLYRYLASKLFAGHGSHSVFMKTWAAGLAYSNGMSSSAVSHRVAYYAERCPELPQTLRFVIDDLNHAPRDPSLAEYAIAQVFAESRAAKRFEERGEGMAHQLRRENISPNTVRAFRSALLQLCLNPQLSDSLFAYMTAVYGSVLPGFAANTLDRERGIYFVIGSEKQMQLYEAYLKSAVGPESVLHRLYPRDFWMTGGR